MVEANVKDVYGGRRKWEKKRKNEKIKKRVQGEKCDRKLRENFWEFGGKLKKI